MFRRLGNHRHQISRRVDPSGPELDEGQVIQLRKMAAEILDDALDDTRIVVGILEEGRDGRAAAEQQAVVASQPEVGIDQLRGSIRLPSQRPFAQLCFWVHEGPPPRVDSCPPRDWQFREQRVTH